MNFNKIHPCPICGKTEYCGWVKSQNGILISCHFVLDTPRYVLVEGRDGKTYISIDTRNGCGLFEEKEQFEKAREEYLGFKPKNTFKKRVFKIDSKNPQEVVKNENLKQNIASDDVLNKVYSEFLQNMPLKDVHKEKLREEKWTDVMIEKSNFHSVPDFHTLRNIINILTKKYNLEGVPGFYVKNGEWLAKIIEGMIIPIYSIDGKIIRLKIKPDWTPLHYQQAKERNEELPKYVMFDSYRKKNKDGKTYEILEKGTKSGSHISYDFEYNYSFETVLITEGEKKSRVVNLLKKMPCLSLPGVSTYSKLNGGPIEILIKRGLKKVIICYDADKKSNKLVKKAEEELIKILLSYGLNVYVADWDERDGKGIDDLLLAGKKPKLRKCKILN